MNLKKLSLIAAVTCSSVFASSMSDINPNEALKLLQDGNKRFVDGKPTHVNAGLNRVKETSKGQHPFVTINACSDSRVPVELLFDRGFGDIFVIRNAGNVSDTDEAGTIEYGTEHLGTRLVVILGHTSCGAVTAVAKGDHVEGNIPKLVDNIVPAVNKIKDKNTGHSHEKWLTEAITENVWQSYEDLLKKSEIVKHLVKDGKVKIVGAMYNVDNGEVKFLGEHPNLKALLETNGSHGSNEASKYIIK
ncbi:MAG: carbonic anhydrase [Sulfurimonas sp.]|nr:MAG: carbonic anhydrase [Sulfurimonas sp.]